MLEFYVGVPGSGKTYRAVNHIYSCFLDTKSKDFKKYDRFHTNINEFNFSKFNTVSVSSATPKIGIDRIEDLDGPVAIPLKIDDLIEKLAILHVLSSSVDDSKLIEKAKDLKLFGTLFVIDEAHNFFSELDSTLVWWLSYHRHLHQDIILITQNLSLLNRKYMAFGEFFYRAVSSSMRVRSTVFTYHQYINYKLYKSSHSDTIKVKFNKDVYALYHSGANTQPKKVLHKFIFLASILFVVAAFAFYFVANSVIDDSDKNSTNKKDNTKLKSVVVNSSDKPSDFLVVVCVDFECSYQGKIFSLSDMNSYVHKYSLKVIDTTKIDNVVFRTYSFNDKFFREVVNASKNITFTSNKL